MKEQNCLITWTIEGFDEYSSQELCPEDDDNDRISYSPVKLIEWLNQIDYEFEQSQQIQVIMEKYQAIMAILKETHSKQIWKLVKSKL